MLRGRLRQAARQDSGKGSRDKVRAFRAGINEFLMKRFAAGNRADLLTQLMTLQVTQASANGRRHYTGTVTRGKHKGKTVTANVPDCGYGWKLFWDKVETHFGQNCYTA